MLSLAPWRRAPLLLWRRRSVAVVLAVAAGVLAAAAASGPLFVSAATDATLAGQLANGCQQGVGLTSAAVDLFHGRASGPDPVAQQMFDLHTTLRAKAVGTPAHLRPPVRQLYSMHLGVAKPGRSGQAFVTFMAKDGALDNVQILSGTKSEGIQSGVWLADTSAASIGAKAGDTVSITADSPGIAPVMLPVAGTYRDLQQVVAGPFWCDDLNVIYATGNSPRFPLMLVSTQTAGRLAAALRLDTVDVTSWGVNSDGLDVDEAGGLNRQLNDVANALPQTMYEARQAAFQKQFPGDDMNPVIAGAARETTETRFNLATKRAQFVSDVLPSTILPITVAAIAVALLLVGGSASFWFERRRREVDVLLAHGVSPSALGVKAVLESAAPVVVGAVGGYFLGELLVSALGPSQVISARATRQAIVFTVVATLVGVLCLAVVATVRCSARERMSAPHRSWLRKFPWDVAIPGVAAGVVAAAATNGSLATNTEGGAVARIDPVVLIVPLLGFLAATALFGRLAVLVLRRVRSSGDRLPNVGWLAWRRITGMPAACALLVGAVALPTAVGIYGATVNASVHRTLDDQNHLLIGADVVIDLTGPEKVPASLDGNASLVLRRDHPALNDTLVSVVGVTPSDFANNVFWDDAIPGPSVPDLIRQLKDDGPGKPLRAIFSGAAPAHSTLSFREGSANVDIPVDVIATPTLLPGAQAGYPVMYVNLSALQRFNTHGTYEFWIRGDPDTAEAALNAAGITYGHVGIADDVTDGSYVQPVSYTFSFLSALVTLAATVAAGALLLYLDARARGRRLSLVLTRRMGLSKAAHFGSIVIELAVTMTVGIVIGAVLALLATQALRSRFSVDPGIPPSTVLSWPLVAVVVDAIVVLVVLVVASFAAHFSSERAKPAEVLRDA
jgi:putative ABC transport system permease protein